MDNGTSLPVNGYWVGTLARWYTVRVEEVTVLTNRCAQEVMSIEREEYDDWRVDYFSMPDRVFFPDFPELSDPVLSEEEARLVWQGVWKKCQDHVPLIAQ